jgi:phosphoadenosine phosphosulfate reductase
MRDDAALAFSANLPNDLDTEHAGAAPIDAPDAPRNMAALAAEIAGLDTIAMLDRAIRTLFPGRICAVSSFGAESAVVLALIAEVAPETPVLFLETGKHFPETLAYRDRLVARLGLTDVRNLTPDAAMLGAVDPTGDLWHRQPDDCCLARKVLPLDGALGGFDAWINGRKRYHGDRRSALPRLEWSEGRIKLNPLADWTAEDVRDAFLARDLPRHPLIAQGYLSIGCAPCTRPSAAAGNPRDGRWQGRAKTECGIHR